MSALTTFLQHSRRIWIAIALGVFLSIVLPDLRSKPPPVPYVPEKVRPSHRTSMLPIVELWNKSKGDGGHFCGKVKSLPGCWDVSDNFVPGNVISGIVRTKRSEALLVTILPPVEFSAQKTTLPIIIYQVPKSPGVFVVLQTGEIQSMEKKTGYELQLKALKDLKKKS